MKQILLFMSLSVSFMLNAQYPFEKFKAIEVKEYKSWRVVDKTEPEGELISTIVIPEYNNLNTEIEVEITCYDTLTYSKLKIFKNEIQIQEMIELEAFYGLRAPYSVFVADFNNDSLSDLKFLIPNFGCGAYNTYSRVIYLLQKPDGKFVKISYTDHFFEDDMNRLERDFDGDGNYEIVTQTFKNYSNHNYWLYNVYSFKGFELVNVNQKVDYPIMIQLLDRDNYDVTKNIKKEKMKEFSRKLPNDYNEK